jgi:uncharacterized protein YjcR
MQHRPTPSCPELRLWYEDERMGVAVIARRVGCSPATISNWLRRCGIPTRSAHFVAYPIDRDELQRLYLDEALPVAQIAAALGVSTSTINNRLRAYGIPRRRRR